MMMLYVLYVLAIVETGLLIAGAIYWWRITRATPWWKPCHAATHEIVAVASIDYQALQRSIQENPNADRDDTTPIVHTWMAEHVKRDADTRAILKLGLFGDPVPWRQGMRRYDPTRHPKARRSMPPRLQ